MKKSNEDVDNDMINGWKNRFKKSPSIYKMTSIKQTTKKSNDDSDDDVINGGKNRFKKIA